ncbi:MAG: sensor histidine kinase [Erysipelotrichaceae bacterium]
MTLKKQWMRFAVLIAVVAIGVHTLLLGSLVNQNFNSYLITQYNRSLSELTTFSERALSSELSQVLIQAEYKSRIADPITRIRLYDEDNRLLVDVSEDARKGMMHSRDEYTETIILSEDGEMIGTLQVSTVSEVAQYEAARSFTVQLLWIGLGSALFVIVLASLLARFASKKTTRDLKQTAQLAQTLQLGNEVVIQPSKLVEIQAIQDTLQTLDQKLKLKAMARKQSVDQMVHETRTPLTILKNHLEAVQDEVMDLDANTVNVCLQQVDGITHLIRNMSDVMDAQQDQARLDLKVQSLSTILEQVIASMQFLFDNKAIELQVSLLDDTSVWCDAVAARQVIYNVLTNALKFSKSESKVSLWLEQKPNELLVHIDDTGIGMSEHAITHAFDAYYREQRNDATGDGLGLFIAKNRMQEMHGDITLTSYENQGTQVLLHFSKTPN